MNKIIWYVFPCLILAAGRATNKEDVTQNIKMSWNNHYMYGYMYGGGMSYEDVEDEFSKTKNTCLLEKHKIPLPSPSCSTVYNSYCPGPLCGLSGSYQKCDYSSVDYAESSRSQVFLSCMELAGWSFEPKDKTLISEKDKIKNNRNLLRGFLIGRNNELTKDMIDPWVMYLSDREISFLAERIESENTDYMDNVYMQYIDFVVDTLKGAGVDLKQ